MSEIYLYDVFLSYSSKDKDNVRDLAERLQSVGLRVWFDEWEIKPGDNIPALINNGLEYSRVLVLCISKNAFGTDWAQLESYTFRFRDPLNKNRRFIPLRLDESPIIGSLVQFVPINWLPNVREKEFRKLLEICRPQIAPAWDQEGYENSGIKIKGIKLQCGKNINSYAFSHDGKKAITGSDDKIIQLWDLKTGLCDKVFNGHTGAVLSVAWSPDQKIILSGSTDRSVRLWDVHSGKCKNVLKGHTGAIETVALNSDYSFAVSGSRDLTIKFWDLKNGKSKELSGIFRSDITKVVFSTDQRYVYFCGLDGLIGRCEFDKHVHYWNKTHDPFWCIAGSPDQKLVITSSVDNSLRVWDVEQLQCIRVLNGHTSIPKSLAWCPDQRFVLSGGNDKTIRLWDIENGQCLSVSHVHDFDVREVGWSSNGRFAFSGDKSGMIWFWEFKVVTQRIPTKSVQKDIIASIPEQVQYTNAKVLLVGDPGVGKSGLSNYLTHAIKVEDNKPLPSTDGAWATRWALSNVKKKTGMNREIWLWDFAGQVDYRLVHQLFMDDTAAAVLVFNPQNEDPFDGLGKWDNDLMKATRKPFAKLLTAARIDRGGLIVSNAKMDRFMKEHGFPMPLYETSAKTGEGCDDLREAIVNAIDWKNIPTITSPALYQRMKEEILQMRDNGMVLIRMSELKQRMELTLVKEPFSLEELQTVISLLAGPGMIQQLEFGGFILLRPEILSRYAAAVVRKVRKHPQELGCIREDEMLAGKLDYQDFKRLAPEDETVVLRALHETFISRAWCLRQPCDGTAILTFPSYFRRERPIQPSHPNVVVTYQFSGQVEDIYATLVVRLHHTLGFETDQLWKFAADFKTQTGKNLGLNLIRDLEGAARLEVYFAPDVDENSRVLFLRYVHNHLSEQARNVERLRHYFCGYMKCDSYNQPFTDQVKIDKAIAPGGKGKVFCSDCGKPIILLDIMEERFNSPAVIEEVQQMQAEGQIIIDNESRELILVGHAYAIVAEAGQIYRGYTNSDHGIDGEIEFKDDKSQASAKRLYLQLKSGDSYLTKRRRDGAEIFSIKKTRWSDYWQKQAYPVMLVIRTSDGEIRWMDVSSYLKDATERGTKTIKQIVFTGEPFDVMSVRRWRDRILNKGSQ